MAQLVARLVRIEKVRGSNPLSSTIFEQVRAFDTVRSAVQLTRPLQLFGAGRNVALTPLFLIANRHCSLALVL